MDQNWMNHPNLASIDAAKLQMLQSLVSQGKGKGQQDLMPFLMMAMRQTKKSGVSFTPEEMNMIIEVMKAGKSPEETAQMDKMLNLLKMMK
ncbi:MAG: hypothetical protein ACOX8E_02165 [Ruminococcus sp.]|jgi:hypothetical protein